MTDVEINGKHFRVQEEKAGTAPAHAPRSSEKPITSNQSADVEINGKHYRVQEEKAGTAPAHAPHSSEEPKSL